MKTASVNYTKRRSGVKMKAKEVMQMLNISRPTLCRYVKQGLIKIDSIINGKYRYNRESVEKLLCNNINEH